MTKPKAPKPSPDKLRAAQLLGQRGGQATSDAKAQAARENGKKGGRPRKPP